MARHTRRHFLRVTALTAAGTALSCGRPNVTAEGPDGGAELDPDGGAFDAGSVTDPDGGASPDAGTTTGPDEPQRVTESFNFPLGLASGDVEPTRAVLWAKFLGANALRLRVWRMNGAVFEERVADTAVTPADGGFLHLDVAGLVPGERYAFAFFETDASGALVSRSAIGRFRAAFAPGTRAPLIVGASSCTQQGHTPTPLLRAGQRGDLDLFLLLGDTSYNDSAITLAEYRTLWGANLGSPEYRVLRAATSVLATWDDHEVTNDFNPESVSAARLAIATQAFFEHLPLRRNPAAPDRLWKSLRWGDTAEFFVLDGRGERRPSTRTSNDPIYLSRAQMDWLKAGLEASTAVFKVILNSVPISNFGFSTFNPDSWLFYGKQRDELLGWVEDEAIAGVLWVSGDHHFASVGRVSGSGRGANALEVLAGPAAQDANPLWIALQPPRWPFATGTNNYLALELDPDTSTARVIFRDGDDRELFARDFTL